MKLFLDVMFCMKFSSMMLLCKMVVLHRRYAAFCMMLGMIFWPSGTFALSLVRKINKFHKINKQNVQCMILLMILPILLSNYYSGQYVENKTVKQTLTKYRKLNKNIQTYAKKLYYSKPPSGTSVLNSMMMTSINKSMQIYNGNGKKNLDVAFQNIPGTLSHINKITTIQSLISRYNPDVLGLAEPSTDDLDVHWPDYTLVPGTVNDGNTSNTRLNILI